MFYFVFVLWLFFFVRNGVALSFCAIVRKEHIHAIRKKTYPRYKKKSHAIIVIAWLNNYVILIEKILSVGSAPNKLKKNPFIGKIL